MNLAYVKGLLSPCKGEAFHLEAFGWEGNRRPGRKKWQPIHTAGDDF